MMPAELTLEEHMQLWNDAQVQLIDMRLCRAEVAVSFSMPSSGFIFAADNVQGVEFDGVRYPDPADLVLHGGEGTPVQIIPRADHAQFYLLLYRSAWPQPLEPQLQEPAERARLNERVSAVRAAPETPLRRLLHTMAHTWQTGLPGAPLHTKAYFLSFIYEWVQLLHQQAQRRHAQLRLQPQQQPSPAGDPIAQVIDYMKRFYSQQLTLAQLAELVNYSIPHLCALFKETTGHTPIEYLTRLRIEAAKALLAESALDLSDVAEQVGYRDPYYFGRMFKRLAGMSPMKFKRAARDQRGLPGDSAGQSAQLSPLMFKRPALRSIEHALGEAELAAVPRRIVALDWTTAEYLLALGITPLGIAELDGMHQWVSLPIAIPDTIADVGPRLAPDLRKIAALSPDLIVGTRTLMAPFHDSLQLIAPTVAYDLFPTSLHPSEYETLEQSFRHLAGILGLKSLAAAIQRRQDDSYIDLRGYIRSAGAASDKVMLAFGYSHQQHSLLRVSNDGSLSVGVMERLGLSNAYQPGRCAPKGFTTVGIEHLDVYDDAHVMYVVQRNDTAALDRLRQERGWTRLLSPAFKKRSFARSGMIWPYGGPLSVHLLAVAAARSLVLNPPRSR